jgi:hypothetical protein
MSRSMLTYFLKKKILWLPKIEDFDFDFASFVTLNDHSASFNLSNVKSTLKDQLKVIFENYSVLNMLLTLSISGDENVKKEILYFSSSSKFFVLKFQVVVLAIMFMKPCSDSNIHLKVQKQIAWVLNILFGGNRQKLMDRELLECMENIQMFPFDEAKYCEQHDQELRLKFKRDDADLSNIFSYLILPRRFQRKDLSNFAQILVSTIARCQLNDK